MRSAAHFTAELREVCGSLGFDLVQSLSVSEYNTAVDGALRLDNLGDKNHLAFVLGNTRRLWNPFVEAWGTDASLKRSNDPLDDYVETRLSEVFVRLGVKFSIRFAHETGERTVAMQKLAEVAGLARTSSSHLSVHPVFGPWLGLRAAVVVALPGPVQPPERIELPCGRCENQCLPAFEQALAATLESTMQQLNSAGIASRYLDWLRCRDACPVGKAYRYSDAQIRYHYTKDQSVLQSEYESMFPSMFPLDPLESPHEKA